MSSWFRFLSQSMSAIDQLLSREKGCTAAELLSCDEFSLKFYQRKQSLIEFLFKRESVLQMLHLISDSPPERESIKRKFVLPKLASDVLCDEIPAIRAQLVSSECLNVLLGFFEQKKVIQPLYAQHMCKVALCLIRTRGDEILQEMQKRDTVVKMLGHIDCYPICELIDDIASAHEVIGGKEGLKKWLKESNLINNLLLIIDQSEYTQQNNNNMNIVKQGQNISSKSQLLIKIQSQIQSQQQLHFQPKSFKFAKQAACDIITSIISRFKQVSVNEIINEVIEKRGMELLIKMSMKRGRKVVKLNNVNNMNQIGQLKYENVFEKEKEKEKDNKNNLNIGIMDKTDTNQQQQEQQSISLQSTQTSPLSQDSQQLKYPPNISQQMNPDQYSHSHQYTFSESDSLKEELSITILESIIWNSKEVQNDQLNRENQNDMDIEIDKIEKMNIMEKVNSDNNNSFNDNEISNNNNNNNANDFINNNNNNNANDIINEKQKDQQIIELKEELIQNVVNEGIDKKSDEIMKIQDISDSNQINSDTNEQNKEQQSEQINNDNQTTNTPIADKTMTFLVFEEIDYQSQSQEDGNEIKKQQTNKSPQLLKRYILDNLEFLVEILSKENDKKRRSEYGEENDNNTNVDNQIDKVNENNIKNETQQKQKQQYEYDEEEKEEFNKLKGKPTWNCRIKLIQLLSALLRSEIGEDVDIYTLLDLGICLRCRNLVISDVVNETDTIKQVYDCMLNERNRIEGYEMNMIKQEQEKDNNNKEKLSIFKSNSPLITSETKQEQQSSSSSQFHSQTSSQSPSLSNTNITSPYIHPSASNQCYQLINLSPLVHLSEQSPAQSLHQQPIASHVLHLARMIEEIREDVPEVDNAIQMFNQKEQQLQLLQLQEKQKQDLNQNKFNTSAIFKQSLNGINYNNDNNINNEIWDDMYNSIVYPAHQKQCNIPFPRPLNLPQTNIQSVEGIIADGLLGQYEMGNIANLFGYNSSGDGADDITDGVIRSGWEGQGFVGVSDYWSGDSGDVY